MGLFDKLFGKKKSSEPKPQPEEDRQDQPRQDVAAQAEVTPEEPPQSTSVETDETESKPAPEPETESASAETQETAGSAPPDDTASSKEQPGEEPPTGKSQLPDRNESESAPEPVQEAASEPANTIECTGCGRQLPIPLPGHPAKITCPFCATENEYRP